MLMFHRRPRFPFLLTAALSLIHVGAAYRALTRPADLAGSISLLPAFETVAAALWALTFAIVTLRLWQRVPSAKRPLGWVLIAWIGYSLLRLAVFARADYDAARLPFLSFASILACALIYIIFVRPIPARKQD
jgi:hypothetical protein